jgi:hypothetical protein
VQALLQRSAMVPQLYDQRKVEEMFLRNLKVSDDDVLNPQPGTEDIDPVSENVAAAMGRPIYVLPRQEHIAHMKTHLAFLKSPLFGQNPAIIKTYLYPMAQHLRDHLLNYYLAEAHEAVDIAQRKQLIPEEAEAQIQVILQVQQEIEKQLGQFAQELAQIDEAAQQFKPQPPMPPDSSMQIAQLNAQIQGQALQQRAQLDAQKLELDKAKLQLAGQAGQQKTAVDAARLQAEDAREQLRQSSEDQRTAIEVKARMAMNTADNDTAMRLAAAEIATGDRIAVSTGTGINPNP